MTKIFLGTPAYSGTVSVQYALALSDTQLLLSHHQIELFKRINTSGSLLVAERNRLIEAFIETDCTHMLCIDADLGWPPIAVKALIDHDVDFVAGVYPSRKEKAFTFRPSCKEGEPLTTSDRKLIKMDYIPAGFMLIKRHVIETMREKFPELYYEPKDPRSKREKGYCLFNTEVWNGEFWGEDYVFCRKVRECGFDIWVDPFIEFDHDGMKGMLLEVLTNQKPEEKQNESKS